MIRKLKELIVKKREESYRDFINSQLELDSEFYQGEVSMAIKILKAVEKIEEEYTDDFK